MRDADHAADQRFEKSEAAAQLVVIGRQINEQTDLLDSLAPEEKELVEERIALDAAWAAMWAATTVVPQDPDVMIQWMRARSDIMNLIGQHSASARQVAAWQGREAEARCLVQAECDALGLSSASLAAQPLHVVLETAAAVERAHEDAAKTRRELEGSQRKATSDAARKRKALETAETEWKDWLTRWDRRSTSSSFLSHQPRKSLTPKLMRSADMREAAGRINDLRHERIEKIERDMRAFDHDVAALAQAAAPQLTVMDAEDAVLELERLIAEARRVRDLAVAKETDLSGLRKKIDECRESCRDARDVICRLQATAGVETIDTLWAVIRQSDEMRGLQTEFDRLTDALAHDGDGLSIAALNDECAATDLDEVTAKEQTVTQDVNELREQLMEVREKRTNARREFEVIGGDDRAARDAADRQPHLPKSRRSPNSMRACAPPSCYCSGRSIAIGLRNRRPCSSARANSSRS